MKTLLNENTQRLNKTILGLDADVFFEVKGLYNTLVNTLKENKGLKQVLLNTLDANDTLGNNKAQSLAIVLALHAVDNGIDFFVKQDNKTEIPVITKGKDIASWTGYCPKGLPMVYAQRADGVFFVRYYDFNGYGKAWSKWEKTDAPNRFCQESKAISVGFRSLSFDGLRKYRLPK